MAKNNSELSIKEDPVMSAGTIENIGEALKIQPKNTTSDGFFPYRPG